MSEATRARPRLLSLTIGGLIALAAALGIGRFVYTPILPFMIADLGLSKSTAGLIASANFAGYLAGALFAALPGIGGSQRGWLIWSLAASGLTSALMGLTDSVAAMMVLRFAGGAASAFVLIHASALVLERLRTHHRNGLAAVHFAGIGVGIMISALLVTGLAAEGLGWRPQWLASGGLTLAALAAVLLLVPGSGPAAAAPPPATGRRKPGYGAIVTAYGLFGFGYVITATFMVAITRGTPAIRPLEPVIWLIVGAAAVPSVDLWMRVGRLAGLTRALALACLVEAAGVVFSVLWVSQAGMIGAAVLLGGTLVGITALGIAVIRDLSPGDPGRAIAAMTAAFGAGQIIGPFFAGMVSDWTGNYVAASLAAAAALLVASLLCWLVPQQA